MDEDEDKPKSATSQTPVFNFPLRRSSIDRQRVIAGPRQGLETPFHDGNKSSSPALSEATTSAYTPVGLHFPDVSTELRFYLNYFYDNITDYHYGAVNNADNFIRSILPQLVIQNEALLFAVVAFSAYYHSMRNPKGRFNEFLQYYNRSITLLLACLTKKEKYSIGTLLTILQLATIEVNPANPSDTGAAAY